MIFMNAISCAERTRRDAVVAGVLRLRALSRTSTAELGQLPQPRERAAGAVHCATLRRALEPQRRRETTPRTRCRFAGSRDAARAGRRGIARPRRRGGTEMRGAIVGVLDRPGPDPPTVLRRGRPTVVPWPGSRGALDGEAGVERAARRGTGSRTAYR